MSAARVAAVPLLALTGVTACASDGKPAARTAQSPPSQDDKTDDKKDEKDEKKGEFRGDKPVFVPTNEQTAEVMLTAEEAPRGYEAGPVNKLFVAWSGNYRVTPEACTGVIDDSLTRGLVGSMRFYAEKGTAEDGVWINVFGGDHDDLVKRLDDLAAAVEGCTSFQESNGTDWWDYKVGDVRRGTYGPGSVSYRFTYVEGTLVVDKYRVLTVDGTVAVDVTSEAEAKSGKPDEPIGFVNAQRDKIGRANWTAGVPTSGTSTKPSAAGPSKTP
ncbi:hypothetical protein [Yinghuangia aomiensis]